MGSGIEAAPARPSIDLVDDALHALSLFARAPLALGGLHLKGWHGPRRAALLGWLRRACSAAAPDRGIGWHTLAHHTSPDSLDASIDLTESIKLGRPVRRAGLVELFGGGVVVLQMAERAPSGLCARLAAEIDARRFALIVLDESLPDEAGPRPGLVDRLALTLDLRDETAWRSLDALSELGHARSPVALTERVSRLDPFTSRLGSLGYKELCEAAQLLDVPSLRGVLQASLLARLSAVEAGRVEASHDDLAFALRQVLLPRARVLPSVPESETERVGEEPGPNHPDDLPEPESFEQPEDGADPSRDSSPPEDLSEPDTLPDGAGERLVEAALANLPPGLLAMLASGIASRGPAARSAGAGGVASGGRGRARSIGARRGQPRGQERIHVLATLRAALPWQRLRGRESGTDAQAPVRFRPDDLHVHRERRRRGTTTVFVVDASGSTALQRLSEAKGAVELLLADCYVRRDRVALVSFRGAGAEVLLAPTRSLVAARRALAALPGGGGSPVAAGLDLAARLSGQLVRSGDDVQLVVLTDGRANLSRRGEPGRERAVSEAKAMARQLAPLASQRVLIDTSVRPEPAAQAIAQALEARYVPMPFARARAIREAIASATR
jgi:magnesium chelatase subunit D